MSGGEQAFLIANIWLATSYITPSPLNSIIAALVAVVFGYIAYRQER